jgi:hypothetical protein
LVAQDDLWNQLRQVDMDQAVVGLEGRPWKQRRKSTHGGPGIAGPKHVPITGTHPDLHTIQTTAKGLHEQLGHDMIRDLVGSDSLVFKPREFLSAVDEDINVGIGRFQMNTGQMGVGRIVFVQDRDDPPVLVGDGDMVLSGVEIVERERR